MKRAALKQYTVVVERLIHPFLTTMKAHNNPGAETYDGIGLGWDLSTFGEAIVLKIGVNGTWRFAIYEELSAKPIALGHNEVPNEPVEQMHIALIKTTLQETLTYYGLPPVIT